MEKYIERLYYMEKLKIARPVEPEQYEWIKNVVLSFGYGPDGYMVIDIKGKQNDLLFIQTKRCSGSNITYRQ